MVRVNEFIKMNKESWEKSADVFFGKTALPEYGPYSFGEEELRLFGEIENKKVIEIGCGSGHSLQYMANQGAEELWGLDFSSRQIEVASDLLSHHHEKVRLFESPMEENPGLPNDYFDIAYSIYALGWTVDLKRTLTNIYYYLKQGGYFIFSWEHPIHNRLVYEQSKFTFARSYHQEGPERPDDWHNTNIVLHHRKLSTYLNLLIDVGFTIEKVMDEVNAPSTYSPDEISRWYSPQKAQLVPATFIIKASKK